MAKKRRTQISSEPEVSSGSGDEDEDEDEEEESYEVGTSRITSGLSTIAAQLGAGWLL